MGLGYHTATGDGHVGASRESQQPGPTSVASQPLLDRMGQAVGGVAGCLGRVIQPSLSPAASPKTKGSRFLGFTDFNKHANEKSPHARMQCPFDFLFLGVKGSEAQGNTSENKMLPLR